MEIRATIPKLYKTAMKIYEESVMGHTKDITVRLTITKNDDLSLLAVFTELAQQISQDFKINIKVDIE